MILLLFILYGLRRGVLLAWYAVENTLVRGYDFLHAPDNYDTLHVALADFNTATYTTIDGQWNNLTADVGTGTPTIGARP